jgi:hypothetical protein
MSEKKDVAASLSARKTSKNHPSPVKEQTHKNEILTTFHQHSLPFSFSRNRKVLEFFHQLFKFNLKLFCLVSLENVATKNNMFLELCSLAFLTNTYSYVHNQHIFQFNVPSTDSQFE